MATTEDRREGLRERKKRRTRQAISDVATHLFAEHGFEEVTLAQIAEAAEVSVKTILNHFGSKEELYFDRAQEVRAALLDAIARRPPGTGVVQALRALLTDNFTPFPDHPWDVLDDPGRLEAFRAFLATQDRSPALRAHRLVMEEELVGLLRDALADELGRRRQDPVLRALATMLVAALQVRERVLRETLLAGLPAAEARSRVTAVVTAAFDRLAAAFGDVDRPREGAAGA